MVKIVIDTNYPEGIYSRGKSPLTVYYDCKIGDISYNILGDNLHFSQYCIDSLLAAANITGENSGMILNVHSESSKDFFTIDRQLDNAKVPSKLTCNKKLIERSIDGMIHTITVYHSNDMLEYIKEIVQSIYHDVPHEIVGGSKRLILRFPYIDSELVNYLKLSGKKLCITEVHNTETIFKHKLIKYFKLV